MFAVQEMDVGTANHVEHIMSYFSSFVRQVAVMRMCDHPNVLSCYASFVHENELWLVMEFMSKGSCLHVMNVAKKEVTDNGDTGGNTDFDHVFVA